MAVAWAVASWMVSLTWLHEVCWSLLSRARSLSKSDGLGCVGGGSSVPAGGRVSSFSECLRESLAVLGQLPVPLEGGFQAGQQGGVGGALARRDRRRRCSPGGVAEAFDLGTDVGLGVEPGPGDTGGAGDGLEGDRCSCVVKFA